MGVTFDDDEEVVGIDVSWGGEGEDVGWRGGRC